MSPGSRLFLSVLALYAVFVVGTAGYMVIEKGRCPSLFDAAFMTVITLSTVGYTEVWKLSDPGRLWSVGVIVFGIATVSVAFTSLIALFVSGDLRSVRERKRMEQRLQHVTEHVILCGFGRMGALVVKELTGLDVPLVVVELASELESALLDANVGYVRGDATEEDVLLRAGLMRAKSLVAVLPHDADNVFITLTARTLRPDLFIVARAEQPTTEAKLKRAGATRVICPQIMGATRITNVITRPTVVDLVEMANKGVNLEMDEYIVPQASSLVGKSLRDSHLRERTGASVVTIKRSDGETLLTPDPNSILDVGDTLVLVGAVGLSNLLVHLDDRA